MNIIRSRLRSRPRIPVSEACGFRPAFENGGCAPDL